MSSSNIPNHANPQGEYVLDNVLELIREQWRNGRQIVPLLGAGISVESGVPAIIALREHLLSLHVLQGRHFHWGKKDTGVPAYSLDRDEWIPPSRLAEYLPHSVREEEVRRFLKKNYEDKLFWNPTSSAAGLKAQTESSIDAARGNDLVDFALTLGLDWLELMEEIACHRPELVDIIFDALGTRTTPGPTHNLLTHCVNWFNIRLILTTNFDNMVERSLNAEGMDAHTYDIHMQAPPPPKLLVERHLSVIKLHGSHYGLRADRSVDQPLDRGHQATLLDYLQDDVILLCLGYGGSEKRITGFIQALLKEKPEARVIRVDPMSPSPGHFFHSLHTAHPATSPQPWPEWPRVTNIYYPPSAGLFLLHLYQYAANRLPNTRSRYPAAPHTAAPHKTAPTLGRNSSVLFETPPASIPPTEEKRQNEQAALDIVQDIQAGQNWAIVSSHGNAGTSGVLAQVYEKLFRTHQTLWFDLDEATSVGTVLGWMHDFADSRQPALPRTPLPLHLPAFQVGCKQVKRQPAWDGDLDWQDAKDLNRAVRNLWSRLSREKFVVILDSLSTSLESLGARGNTPRCQREAARLLLMVAILLQHARNPKTAGRCVVMVGTHTEFGSAIKDIAQKLDQRFEKWIEDLPEGNESERKDKATWGEIRRNVHDLTRPREVKPPKYFIGFQPPAFWKTIDNAGEVVDWIRDHRSEVPVDQPGRPSGYPARDWVWNLAVGSAAPADPDNSADTALWASIGLPAAEAQKYREELKQDLDRHLARFALECAICNRPRSWRELLQLPSVKEMGDQLQPDHGLESSEAPVLFRTMGHLRAVEAGDGYQKLIADPQHKCALRLDSLRSLDRRSRALHILINGAVRRRLLYLQPGGFYYMDGICRAFLRLKCQGALRSFTNTCADNGDPIEETHRRMAAFFERSYNQSGDVTTLNHFFWHTLELLKIARSSSKAESYRIIESCIARLLENSLPARGGLYAYDHCFLLLRLRDALEALGESGLTDSLQEVHNNYRRRILHALCEVYEDNVDWKSGKSAADALLQEAKKLEGIRRAHRGAAAAATDTGASETAASDAVGASDTANSSDTAATAGASDAGGTILRRNDNYDIARAYYRLQKAQWQGLKAEESIKSAHHALACLLCEQPGPGRMEPAQRCEEIEAKNWEGVLDGICDVLGLGGLPYDPAAPMPKYLIEALQNRYGALGPTSHRILFHRIILRLIRSLIRVAKFGKCALRGLSDDEERARRKQRQKVEQMCEVFLRFGNEINLGEIPTPTTIKLLTARYNSSRGLQALFELGQEPDREPSPKMTYYNHQAQSRAIRAEGAASAVYEANTLIDEAEMLLWKARITLRKANDDIWRDPGPLDDLARARARIRRMAIPYADAAARQDAAVRHFDTARGDLLAGSVSLAAWRELTVLRAGATADILKRLTCQHLDLQDCLDKVEPAAKALEGDRSKAIQKADLDREAKDLRQKRAAVFADFSYHAEQGAFELGYLLPLFWNSTWRGGRAGIQLLRIGGYICRMIWKMLPLIEREVASQARGDGPPLIVSLNGLIRAVNNFDLGSQAKIPSVPLKESSDFEAHLWHKLAAWIFRIEAWLDVTLNSKHWDDFPEAFEKDKARRQKCQDEKLCSRAMEALRDCDPDSSDEAEVIEVSRAIQALKRAFTDNQDPWKRGVRKWPNVYVEDA